MYRAVTGIASNGFGPRRDRFAVTGSGTQIDCGAMTVGFITDSPGRFTADFGVLLFDDFGAKFIGPFAAGNAVLSGTAASGESVSDAIEEQAAQADRGGRR